jgi:hypothetical protein
MKFERLPEWCFRLGIIYLLIGMGFGVFMGVTEDFAYKDVHAHFNLLGYASTFLIGFFLKFYPAALKSKPVIASVLFVHLSVALMLFSLALFYCGCPSCGPVLGVFSIQVFVAYVLFAAAVFHVTARKAA